MTSGYHSYKEIRAIACASVLLASANIPAYAIEPEPAPTFVNPVNRTPPTFGNPTILPTDTVPLSRDPETSLLNRELRFAILKKLPTRLWFTVTNEVSQRYENNVFFTYSHHKGDYAFRVLPNVSVGYNVFKRTSVYGNYFVIKDEFAVHRLLSFPTTQSLSLGVRHEVPLGSRGNMQLDLQARELWQTSHLRQADLLPSVNFTYALAPSLVAFASALVQLRGRNYFVAPTREIDPFYTIGALYQRGRWTFTATNTFINNFRSPPFSSSIPRQGNTVMISDFEISRPVIKQLPSLTSFIRVEPVWNWQSKKQPGLSGFDVRVFGGLRLALSKQSYQNNIEKLREQLIDAEEEAPNQAPANETDPASKQQNSP